MDRWSVVLDIGKTAAKLTLWNETGALVAQRSRRNGVVATGLYLALDTDGIEAWLAETLAHFARLGPIGRIVPVAHGAALAILRDGALACPPMDYENPMPEPDRAAYDAGRDPFLVTGSPKLPLGLNLGAQLHMLESLWPGILDGGSMIAPWAQYWAWVLSGVAASEISSLGCHTDLWRPQERGPSNMSVERGWAGRMAPLREAGEVLGPILPAWALRTGLSRDVLIFCGLHDSNAALVGARWMSGSADHELTALSTGTWFVAMRMSGKDVAFDLASLREARDCLVNVDPWGGFVPSSRFMGGREIELLSSKSLAWADSAPRDSFPDALRTVADRDVMVLPTQVRATGPFPNGVGRWERKPDDAGLEAAAIAAYAALMVDASLDLIGARERILVEGRFARDRAFVEALATLRSSDDVYVSDAHDAVTCGALRMLGAEPAMMRAPSRVEPLPIDLEGYRSRWRERIEPAERAS